MLVRLLLCDHAGPLVHEDKKGYPFQTDRWAFSYRAPQALRILQDECNYVIVLAASHSGVARGMYTLEEMYARHAEMERRLRVGWGVEIAATGFCPHMPEAGCDCRKPKTGMFDQIVAQLIQKGRITTLQDIDLANSVMLGDKGEDIGLGNNCHFGTTILMTSRYWSEVEPPDYHPTHIVSSLIQAAYLLWKGIRLE